MYIYIVTTTATAQASSVAYPCPLGEEEWLPSRMFNEMFALYQKAYYARTVPTGVNTLRIHTPLFAQKNLRNSPWCKNQQYEYFQDHNSISNLFPCIQPPRTNLPRIFQALYFVPGMCDPEYQAEKVEVYWYTAVLQCSRGGTAARSLWHMFFCIRPAVYRRSRLVKRACAALEGIIHTRFIKVTLE